MSLIHKHAEQNNIFMPEQINPGAGLSARGKQKNDIAVIRHRP